MDIISEVEQMAEEILLAEARAAQPHPAERILRDFQAHVIPDGGWRCLRCLRSRAQIHASYRSLPCKRVTP